MTQGNSDYASDITLWWQYEITTENRRIAISDQTLTDFYIDLDVGVYLVANDKTTEPAEVDAFSYLLDEIESKLNTAVTNGGGTHTYSFALATPSTSSDYTNGGVSLSTSDSSDFTLEFADTEFTLHKGVFGFADQNTTAKTSTSGTLTGDFTQWGRWQAPPNRYPQDQRLDARYEAYSSGGQPTVEGRLEIPQTRMRRWHWFDLPAASVKAYRARSSALAAKADLGTDDTNNALQNAMETNSKRLILAQGAPSTSIDPWEVATHEVVRFPRSVNLRKAFSDIEGGERYECDIPLDLVWQSGAAITDTHLG